jgi:hypothetical protein
MAPKMQKDLGAMGRLAAKDSRCFFRLEHAGEHDQITTLYGQGGRVEASPRAAVQGISSISV